MRAVLEGEAAFVAAMAGGRRVVEAIDRLALATESETLVDALSSLFVEGLGFAPAALDETTRLGEQRTISRLRRVATYGPFVVSLAETKAAWPYPNTMLPVFRLHPHGLVIGATPGFGTCRFFFRRVGARSHEPPRFRTLVGSRIGRDPAETLVTWALRLALLRPRFGDDAAGLTARAEQVLDATPADICGRWHSATFEATGAPPGPPWERVWRNAVANFLQGGAPGRRHFRGLERALRDAFPMRVGAYGFLHCRGYVENCPPESLVEAWREGRTALHGLSLILAFVPSSGEPETQFTVSAGVPAFDDGGRCVLDGAWWRLRPRLSDGRVVLLARYDTATERAPPPPPLNEEAWPSDFEQPEDAEAFENLAFEPDVNEEAADDVPTLAGAHLETLLVSAVHRKLGGLSRRLYNLPQAEPPLPAIRRALDELRAGGGRFVLTSLRWLRSFLQPHPGGPSDGDDPVTIVAVDARSAGCPPAWACIEVCADLPHGHWYPVSGARLDPAGDLMLPVAHAGALRLARVEAAAPDINPRCGGTGAGPRSGWIASGLAAYAALPALTLPAPVCFAWRSAPRSMSGLRRQGSELVLHLARTCRPGPRPLHRLCVDVPLSRRSDTDHPPRLLVQAGESVVSGQIWLQRPPGDDRQESVRSARGSMGALASAIGENWTGGPRGGWRIPPGCGGMVVQARLHPIFGRARTPEGWRATLEIRLAMEWPQHALLSDGRLARLSWSLMVADAPYDAEGQPFLAVLEDPTFESAVAETLFDPIAESPFLGERLEPLTFRVHIAERAEVTGPDLHLAFRLRDGEGIPADLRAPSLTAGERLWWQCRDPAGASALADIECTFAGGAPPAWPRIAALLEVAGLGRPAWAPQAPGDGGIPRPSVAASDVAAEESDDGCEASIQPDGIEAVDVTVEPTAPESALPPVTLVPMDPSVPDDAEVEGSDDEDLAPWPRHTAARRRVIDPMEGTQFLGPTEGACTCGEISGTPRLWETCLSCGSRVRVRFADALGDRPRIPLPEPVLHPWFRPGVGAALTLSAAELRERVIEIGPSAIRAALGAALLAPEAVYEAGAERVRSLAPGQTRRALARGIWMLRALGASDRGLERLIESAFVDAAVILPSYLHPTGHPIGAPAAVASTLTDRHLETLYAAERLARVISVESELEIFRTLARRRLYDAVDALFGDPEQGPSVEEPSDFARLLVRLRPLTKPRALRSVVPGLVAVRGLLEERGHPVWTYRLDHVALGSIPQSIEPVKVTSPGFASRSRLAVAPALSRCDPRQDEGPFFPALVEDLRPISVLSLRLTPGLRRSVRRLGPGTIGDLARLPAGRVQRAQGIGEKKLDTLRKALVNLADDTLPEFREVPPAGPPLAGSPRLPPRLRTLPPPGPITTAARADHDRPLSRLELVELRVRASSPGRQTRLVAAASPLVLPARDPRPASAHTAAWAERSARHALAERLLPRLAAILAPLGTEVLKRLAAALDSRTARPSALLEVLEASRPLRLPRSPAEATARLAPIVAAAFPGDAAASAREAFTRILVGFWLGPPAADAPTGWRYPAEDAELDPAWFRAVPPLDTDAWWLLETSLSATAPVLWFCLNARTPVAAWPAVLRLAAGWPVAASEAPAIPVEAEPLPVAPAVPSDEGVPTDQPPVQSPRVAEAEVHLLERSLLRWLRRSVTDD